MIITGGDHTALNLSDTNHWIAGLRHLLTASPPGAEVTCLIIVSRN
jgi:hypothetical protein